MPFFKPSYLKKAENALNYIRKERTYTHDILDENSLKQMDEAIHELEAVCELKNVEGEKRFEQCLKKHETLLTPKKDHDWRENVEIILVALVIALGVRAYFLQPFKIPTHSMNPTLLGIVSEKRTGELPNFFKKSWDFIVQGKTYHRLVSQEGGYIDRLWETRLNILFPITITHIKIGHRTYNAWQSLDEIYKAGFQLTLQQRIAPGDELFNYTTQTGDHVLVNKMTYHLRKPKRGDVIVFTTRNITRIEDSLFAQGIEGSQYYIKRCVGLSGDTLQIHPPYLHVNSQILRDTPAFDRIYSLRDGYNGYVLGDTTALYLLHEDDSYQVPHDHYWAMGDNSRHSFDSRGWGSVPRENLVGTGSFVYWPFTQRWGRIQ